MADIYKQLGVTIQKKRKKTGLTQDDLSDLAGLSYSTLAKIERGAIKNPSVFTIASLAKALHCNIEDLLKGKDSAGASVAVQKSTDTFLFCDINGVLVRFFQKAFADIANEYMLSLDTVETVFWHYNDAANRGELSETGLNEAIADHLGIPAMDWQSRYLDAIEPISEMGDCLRAISKTHHVGLLSNINEGLIAKMIARKLLPDLPYSCIIDSSEVGVIKPESRIYEIAEQKSGFSGGQILFIDDSRTNLMAAERLGWRVLWFDDYRPSESVERLKQAFKQ